MESSYPHRPEELGKKFGPDPLESVDPEVLARDAVLGEMAARQELLLRALREADGENTLLKEELGATKEQVRTLEGLNLRLLGLLHGDDASVEQTVLPDGRLMVVVTPNTIDTAIEEGERSAYEQETTNERTTKCMEELTSHCQAINSITYLDTARREGHRGRFTSKTTRERKVRDEHRQACHVTVHHDGRATAMVRVDSEPVRNDERSDVKVDARTEVWQQRRHEVKLAMDAGGIFTDLTVTRFDAELTLEQTRKQATMTDIVTATQYSIDLLSGQVTIRTKCGNLANGEDAKGLIRRAIAKEHYTSDDVGEPLNPHKKPKLIPNLQVSKRMDTNTVHDRSILDANKWPRFGTFRHTISLSDVVSIDGKYIIKGTEVSILEEVMTACQQALTVKL